MDSWVVVLSFVAIAVMRVAQKVCSKKVSAEVQGKTFFHYGGYYNLLSALFSLITLAIVGFHGFDFSTILCALATAICLAVELFASLEALKGASLIVNQMFSVGALFIPCIVGIFFFDEPMSVWQWVGLFLFIVAMYFMVVPTQDKEKKTSSKISIKTVVMLLLTLVAGGGTMVAQKAFAKVLENGNVAMYSFLMFALNAIILYTCYGVLNFRDRKNFEAVEMKEEKKETNKLTKVLLVCGLILAFAVFVVNALVTELGKSVDSAILFSVSYAISISITILVSSIYYKERITWKMIIGVILCVGALAIINFL